MCTKFLRILVLKNIWAKIVENFWTLLQFLRIEQNSEKKKGVEAQKSFAIAKICHQANPFCEIPYSSSCASALS